MSAYATPQHERLARLLYMNPESSVAARQPVPTQSGASGVDAVIDVLIDRLAQRLAAAIVEQMASHPADPQESWLDSQEAAAYLGMHRDTLRRLAAARVLPAEQDGRGCKLHFRRAALDEWRRRGGAPTGMSAVADAA
jgi:excisionase family DNA binding protein